MGFAQLRESLQGRPGKTLVLAWGLDGGVLKACRQALDHNFLEEVIVTGPPDQVEEAAREAQVSLEGSPCMPRPTQPQEPRRQCG